MSGGETAGRGLRWLAAGAFCAAVAVAAGAFGAHGLAERLDARGLELWEIAARYLMYGGLALGLLGLAAPRGGRDRWLDVAGCALLSGSLLFSSTVAGLALGGPRWLGAVTPLGGTATIVGLALLGARAWAWARANR
ncbi:MAG TPA: DUF423 domain-containing protein [Thermoanaerobaculia bacterium]|nr:DUF423 domain-containing protein [Thermoanaerobaculia bacterium]